MARFKITLPIKRTIKIKATSRLTRSTTVTVRTNPRPSLTNGSSGSSWTERDICRAAVKTYFSLDELPADFEDNGDFKGFKSAAGYIYHCKLEGNVAVLQWVNATKKAMKSRATSFELNGNTLVVRDNSWGATQTFQA